MSTHNTHKNSTFVTANEVRTMKATIITIGDELLNGQTIDTNAAWLGQELNGIGVDVCAGMTIKDTKEAISAAITTASTNSDLIIMTGGLGPTRDDVTKQAIADHYGDDMIFNQENYEVILDLFKRIGRTPKEAHRAQCYMPSSATLLKNKRGTAPGMWFEQKGTILLSMPGVPGEMKGIMRDGGLAKIQAANPGYHVIHHIIKTAGQGETFLAEAIQDIVDQFPSEMSMAYLPGLANVRLRISAKGTDRQRLEGLLQEVAPQIETKVAKWTYAIGDKELQEVIGELCVAKGLKIGTAESCTGGKIANLLTSVPGSSAYYEGSVVSYSNRLKESLLGVSTSTIKTHGAVSEATVRQMVLGSIDTLGIDISVAVSGVAGPGGGTPEKPVGTVWIAVGNKQRVVTRKWQLAKDRKLNIQYTANIALNQLRLFIDNRI